MEPLTTAGLAGPLLKAAASVATGPAKSLLSKKSQRVKVAFFAARKAKDRRIAVSWGSIRRWLARADAQQQLAVGTSEAVESAVSNLAWLIAGDGADRQGQAQELLFIVLIEFLRTSEPSAATALSTAWISEQVAAEGQATRDAIDRGHEAILRQLSAPQVFADDIRSLHPWRRTSAEDIVKVWPGLIQFVHSLVTSGDRAEVLRHWAIQSPASLNDAPAEAWCWFGQVAADYGARHAAIKFFQTGIQRGAVPASYWRARAALHADPLDSEDRSVSASLLAEGDAPHVLAKSVLALREKDFDTASSLLEQWDPDNPNDRALRGMLLSASYAGQQDFNRAISVLLAASEDTDASGPALRAAEMLLSRAHHGHSDHALADSAQALALALRARNARRIWEGDSAAAVLVAVKAAVLSHDTDRAWRLTQPAPLGEATLREVQDPRVWREGTLLSAMSGRLNRAQEMVREADEPFVGAVVAAYAAVEAGNDGMANEAWRTAWEAAPDDVGKLTAAAALAERGADLPELSEIAQRRPDDVAEIRAVHEAASAGAGKLQMLRARAADSPRLTVALADYYATRQNYMEAASTLEAGADRWNHPLLMRMAAYRYQQAGDHGAAQRASESAITLGGPGWAGEFDARVLLFEALEAQGLQDESLQQARRLVTLDANSLDARWALVYCLVRKGDAEAAWNALTPEGDPVPPRNPEDARVWIGLMAAFDTSAHFTTRALATMKRWPDDEELLGIFIAQIYSGLRRDELTPEQADLEALHEATREYTQRFPNSAIFRAIAVPDEDPLSAMADDLRQRHEALSDVEEKVRSGELPLGMLAEAVGASYAEAAIRRAAGMVRSHAPQRCDEAAADVAGALDGPVAIDTTAVCTLALIDPDLRAELVGSFTRLDSTDRAFRDALTAQQVLGLRSTLSAVWDPAVGKPRPVVISDEAANSLAAHSETICRILTGTRRRAWPVLKNFPDLVDHGGWLSTVDMAADSSMAFWCDDYVLGGLAASMGIATFGTIDLMRHLVRSGHIPTDWTEVAEATLIRNYHVELGFESKIMTLAATLDAWHPGGAAFALTRPFTWQRPESVMGFLTDALTHQLDRGPGELGDWVGCAATGLVAIAGDSAGATENLQVLLGRLLNQPWMRPDRFPAIVAGIRQAISERPGIQDPVLPVLETQHQNLVDEHGHVLASQLIMALVQNAIDRDRHAAAHIILTAK